MTGTMRPLKVQDIFSVVEAYSAGRAVIHLFASSLGLLGWHCPA